MNDPRPPVLFFDARCLLCHRSVRWILRHDKHGRFSFAGLDSRAAETVIPADHPLRGEDTVILWDGESLVDRSEAVFGVLRRLPAPWRWLAGAACLPRSWTDALYRGIAARRHRWFGTDDSCALPDPAAADRFLD